MPQVFQYDAAGRRTHADDPDTDLDWYLDAAGQVTAVVDNTLSKTITYAYDATGRRTSLDGPEGSDTQAWSFDAVGRVTKITENANARAEWLYDLAGGETKLTYGSGSYATRLYDAAGRLTSLAHKKSDNSVIQSFSYVLDKVGNRTKLTLNGGDYVEYQYDPLYQLTKEHRKTSGGSTQYYNEFYYNYISNRTKLVYNDGMSSTTSTYSYNAADQLTRDVTGATTTDYSYDASGALTRKSSGGSNFDYLYDARSLITKYDAPGTSNDTTYNWDLLDRRVKKDLNGTVTRFLYDDSIGEIIAEYDGSGTPALQASYVPTGLDSNVSMTRSGTLYYSHPDALQSTWNLTLATDESVQNTYAYQAFGSQYGSPTENATNTRRFAGAEWNAEDSTQTHGIRRYHPTLGRWNRRDPFLDIDFLNLQAYAANNPVLFVDPTGRFRWPWDDGLSCERGQEGQIRYNQFKNPCPKTRTWRYCGRREKCLQGRWMPAGRTICTPCPEPEPPIFGGDIQVDSGLLIGLGTAKVWCCDEKGARHRVILKKICGGALAGVSASGHLVSNINGVNCPSAYTEYFLEWSVGYGVGGVSGEIGVFCDEGECVGGGGGYIGIGSPVELKLCYYKILVDDIEPCGCK